jgi:hypothetical protein
MVFVKLLRVTSKGMNACAFYAVMMFQPRSRQQFTALTQSDDLARVYRDDAVRDSEVKKRLTITKRGVAYRATRRRRRGIGGATIQAVRTHSWADCIISTPGFDLRQGQVTLSTRVHGVFVEAPAGKHAATAPGGSEKEGLSRL